MLPFSGESEFGDTIAEDLITELARFQNVTVAARSASFALRDHAGDTQRVARELGVQFVFEGATRRLGEDRVRIDVRLLEGDSGQVLASERFEQTLDTLRNSQDEIVRQMTGRMAPELDMAGMRRAERLPEAELRVQELALRAGALLWRGSEAEDAAAIDAGLALAREAAERDPRYAEAWRILAFGYCLRGERGAFGPSASADYESADAAAARLRALEPSSYAAHAIGGHVAMRQARHAESLESLRYAHALNPNAVLTMRWLAWEESNHGLAEAARARAEESLRLSSRDHFVYLGHWSLGLALYVGGDPAAATDHVRRAVALTPRFGGYYLLLAACLAEQDRFDEAHDAVERVRRNCPGLFESRISGKTYFAVPELGARYAAALLRADKGRGAQSTAVPQALASLTARERDVLRLVARGLSNAEVGEALGISEHTAKRHIANILLKLDLPTRSAAATLAGRHGLI